MVRSADAGRKNVTFSAQVTAPETKSLVRNDVVVQIDTGAETTCIGKLTTTRTNHVTNWETRNIRCVAGTKLGVFDNTGRNKVASLHLTINNKRIWVNRAVVIDNFDGILLGTPDLDELVTVDMVNKKINFASIGEAVDYGISEVVAAVSSTDRLNAKNF